MPVIDPPAQGPFELPPVPVRRFSVGEYQRMIQESLLGEGDRVELVEGWMIDRMPHGPLHETAIDLAQEALRDRLPKGWRLRVRSAITTAESEPEPDLVVVRGAARDYAGRHPGPGEIALVVEVAETSLRTDRTLKLRSYARAGLPAYWIVNLVDRCVEVHTGPSGPVGGPSYALRQVFAGETTAALSIAGQELEPIAVRGLLP
jgi:Uma2 family endonuclease